MALLPWQLLRLFMVLRRVYIESRQMRGMSLIEVLLSTALLACMATIAVPVSVRWYSAYALRSEVNRLWFVLAAARAQAQANIRNQPAGVWFDQHAYVLFSGVNYKPGDAVYGTFDVDASIHITSTQNPIVFQNISGLSQSGIISMGVGGMSDVITINTEGFIQ